MVVELGSVRYELIGPASQKFVRFETRLNLKDTNVDGVGSTEKRVDVSTEE